MVHFIFSYSSQAQRKQGEGHVGPKPPNNFENNGAMLQGLIRCIVLYWLRTIALQSAATSYGPDSSCTINPEARAAFQRTVTKFTIYVL